MNDIQSAGIEAGSVGACSTCLITLGMDPLLAPIAATVAVFAARLAFGLIESRMRKKDTKEG